MSHDAPDRSTPAKPSDDPLALKAKRRRGIYLLPNLFTTAGLFAGFYSILAAIAGDFGNAAIAIFVAMVMDGLDGRVARLTNTSSAFGMEYDSLTDMVAFGVAPGLVIYLWSLHSLGSWGSFGLKIGWLGAFVYTASTALRLARFNTQVDTADKRYFQGLPSPAAAALVAGMVWFGNEFGFSGDELNVLALIITVLAGVLMVSNVRYSSFKQVDLRGRIRFVHVLGVALAFGLIFLNPPLVIFGGFLVYVISGPVLTLLWVRRHRAERLRGGAAEDEPTD